MMTGSVYYGRIPSLQRKWRRIVLAFLYCAGLLIGAMLAVQASDCFLTWMRSVEIIRMSIVGLLTVTTLPFLISALAVLISQSWLLFPICFLKALSFGFCSGGVWFVFGSAGWLGCGLLLFTDLCALPVLFCYWLRHIEGTKTALSEAALYMSLLFLAGSLDHCLISPFAAGILSI